MQQLQGFTEGGSLMEQVQIQKSVPFQGTTDGATGIGPGACAEHLHLRKDRMIISVGEKHFEMRVTARTLIRMAVVLYFANCSCETMQKIFHHLAHLLFREVVSTRSHLYVRSVFGLILDVLARQPGCF